MLYGVVVDWRELLRRVVFVAVALLAGSLLVGQNNTLAALCFVAAFVGVAMCVQTLRAGV